MVRSRRAAVLAFVSGALVLAILISSPLLCRATTITMRDGRILEGAVGQIGGLAENAIQLQRQGAVPGARPITVIDDDVRRTYVPEYQIAKVEEAEAEVLEKIHIKQRIALAGTRIARVGPIVRITDFDEWGRRTFSMAGDRGQIDVIQGITTITPRWTKVEGLVSGKPFVWDMRITTSSIPRATLSRILSKNIDPKNLDQRLQLVRLFLQAERYTDAQKELELILQDFPAEENLKKEARALRQLAARRTIDEINVRRKAGQHHLAYTLLDKFPSEDVAGETLQQVRELVGEYEATRKQGEELFQQLAAHVAAIKDYNLRQRCLEVLKEIKAELNINTLDRMADYLRLASDESMKAEEKFALAASGWLLGSNAASTNLAVALSQFQVRDLIRVYLAEPVRNKRDAALKQLESLEGASPKQVSQILANMKPPVETPLPESGPPGLYSVTVPGIDKEPDVTYHVQLPPEYDPYRRYPTVLTLNGGGTTAIQQIDWWAGALGDNNMRLGQATRFGYIVIAVEWTKEGQRQYDYSAREHHAVLASLRDACRRFAINTDRVYLSGHSMGGDAAWDIGLAHPDLWAGVIPIVAVSDRYCAHYFENAKLLPLYVVAGELDGDKTKRNARDLDRCMIRRYDVTVSEYMGRGHEHFSDEIQRLFDWMGRHERNFYPKDFQVSSMRTWDNFFWWLEVEQFPPRSIVEPSDWPPKPGYRAMEIKAKINGNNVYVTSGADRVSVLLSPELVDFSKPVRVKANGKSLNNAGALLIEPSVETMLDDVRTRGDRLHPFWAKVE